MGDDSVRGGRVASEGLGFTGIGLQGTLDS